MLGMRNKIVICEDDKEIRELLVTFLTDLGYECLACDNGIKGYNTIMTIKDIDLVILDLMLPFKSGDSILHDVREVSSVPVIVVSAKDTVRTKIELIKLGADDYITKPFDLDELAVRIEAVLRRSGKQNAPAEPKLLTFKNLTINKESMEVTVSGKVLSFALKEYAILELLLENPDRLFSKADIYERVWKERYLEDDNIMKVHMSNIRSKLKEADPDNKYIETVWGMGYRLQK